MSVACYDDSEFDGEIGCTLSLVQKAAMRPSDEEEYSSYSTYSYSDYSSYSDEEEEYDDEDSDQEEEEESDAEQVLSGAKIKLNLNNFQSAESIVSGDEVLVAGEVILREVSPTSESVTFHEEELPIAETFENETVVAEQAEVNRESSADPAREIKQMTAYVKPSFDEGVSSELTTPMLRVQGPKTDFAKKAVVQPMKTEKFKLLDQPTPLVKEKVVTDETFVSPLKIS